MKMHGSKADAAGKKVMLVEFNNWHDECIFSAYSFLRWAGCKVTLVLNEKLRNRIPADVYSDAQGIIFLPFGSLRHSVSSFRKIRRMLKSEGFTHLFLNTAQGSVAWKFFLLPLRRSVKIAGTIHNIAKLKGSLGQKFITHRIDKYVLLSDVLVEGYRKVCSKPVSVLYPIDYPKYNKVNIEKPADEVWIAVPGEISLKRRDYYSIVSSSAKYDRRVKFLFLCNSNRADGSEVMAHARECGVEQNIMSFNSYVSNEEFYSYIELCDYVMPLVHPSKSAYAKYLTEKISGTYNLAFAYRKPMICPEAMSAYEDFADTSLFYKESELCAFVNSLASAPQAGRFYKLAKWDAEERYRNLEQLLL
ncbi:MAG: hypothetical protein IKJ95_08170 [Bacteroidaceae bacterium]|nr:hypothetical protein [Bacteroidaceae bacterium]